LFEGASEPPGRKFHVHGLRDEGACVSPDVAYAINGAGEIVGQTCSDQAVRFSRAGYAERLPVGPAKFGSGAQAIN
jgi:hypothetical protein